VTNEIKKVFTQKLTLERRLRKLKTQYIRKLSTLRQ